MIQRSQTRHLDLQLIYTVTGGPAKIDIFTSVVSLATMTRFDLVEGEFEELNTTTRFGLFQGPHQAVLIESACLVFENEIKIKRS